jgi:hypothetical protein
MSWPPRSLNLTPKDFFLWAHLKALFYTSPVDFEEDLIAHDSGSSNHQAATWDF